MKRWNTAICDNINGSGEYQAKQSESGRKSHETYDFTHMWGIKPKATNEQAWKTNKNSWTGTVWWLPEIRGGGNNRGQIYGRRFDFGW